MPSLRAQVILHTADSIPANYITNSWAFTSSTPIGAATQITAALKAFYDSVSATSMAATITQNGHEIKYYDLPGVKPNYPATEALFNLALQPVGNPLPAEMAMVLSFQGTRTPGLPQARRRGRVYIGGIKETVNSSGRPVTSAMNQLATAALTFKTAIAAITPAVQWAVWSGTDGAAVPVASGWVDNAFDVQRRRGVKATSRTIW